MSEVEGWLPTEKNVQDYLLHSKMLSSLALEVRELSRKKQEGTLNLTKVRMINRVLKPLKEDLLAHVPASLFLDLLDEDALPNNSDAVLIISQYEAAIKEFKKEYYKEYIDENYTRRFYWTTQEHPDGNSEGLDVNEDE